MNASGNFFIRLKLSSSAAYSGAIQIFFYINYLTPQPIIVFQHIGNFIATVHYCGMVATPSVSPI